MKKYLSILFVFALITSLCAFPVVASADSVVITVGVYDNVFDLENKDSAWAPIIGDGIGAAFGYNNSGTEFVFGLSATGLANDTEYSLIYYADTEDRYVDWGGDYPGALIATFTTDGSGNIAATSLSVDLGMDLPCPPDANAYFYDYTLSPDNYADMTGAKVWLVPSSAYDAGNKKVISWAPTTFLFETQLVNYDDTEVVSDIIAISVIPDSVNFGIITPGTTGDGGSLTIGNTGNVPVNITATVSSTGVFQYVNLDGDVVSAYFQYLSPPPGSIGVAVTLPVPGNYTPTGNETGTLTFIASALP